MTISANKNSLLVTEIKAAFNTPCPASTYQPTNTIAVWESQYGINQMELKATELHFFFEREREREGRRETGEGLEPKATLQGCVAEK